MRWNISSKARWVDVFQTGREKIPVKPRPTKTPVFRADVTVYRLRLCKFVQVVEFCVLKHNCLGC